MDPALLISIAAFVGVAALVGGLTAAFKGDRDNKIEDRLDALTGAGGKGGKGALVQQSALYTPLDAVPGVFEAIVQRFGRLKLLFAQADTSLTPAKFLAISAGLLVAGTVVGAFAGFKVALAPLMGLSMAFLPLLWLIWRKKRRLKAFAAQLPDALELISRALRAGHSLAAGMNLVQSEMASPISVEFGRVFEEQNLGIPMEDALISLADRVPNLDLRFFSTAVILQRQTGGDLAEILDKIAHLVRERFKVWGQVQALTGEGRLSGIVLLALPPVLFLAVYRLNPDYIMLLFTDPMGKQMLAGAVVMQVLGALAIRKIINIKV
ncbi:MAG TPA: type II secretion system F family protein [Pirellulales bacterium]|nr:type II secretion system F family protein [Pirellulales bacterium]